jgi:hypothetical protein
MRVSVMVSNLGRCKIVIQRYLIRSLLFHASEASQAPYPLEVDGTSCMDRGIEGSITRNMQLSFTNPNSLHVAKNNVGQ